jgi:hypothetical protein
MQIGKDNERKALVFWFSHIGLAVVSPDKAEVIVVRVDIYNCCNKTERNIILRSDCR